MCFGGSPSVEPAPPPAAPPSKNPVMTNMYDPSSPESGMAAEKGAVSNKAKGTSQLKVDLDPTTQSMGKGTGLQINK
jgi:hypothetical protein